LNKAEVQAYFDRRAPEWDSRMIRCQKKIDAILDAAGVGAGKTVLDVACGTGVLFEDYLARGAERVVGVDLSPEMVRIARRKFPQSHIEVRCADIEEALLDKQFDCCVVYNALPHFTDPGRLIQSLSRHVKPGGRLCIAHSMSREVLAQHHAGRADSVSRPVPEIGTLSAMFLPWFIADIAISDHEKYITAGVRK
jgi:demethylmenaquinone methyltransferase/2-methoxy-6-polyprenyl-1,4-benzoquinol methylase